jgi:hypothetical protein
MVTHFLVRYVTLRALGRAHAGMMAACSPASPYSSEAGNSKSQRASLSWCQARDQFFFLLEIFLRRLRVSYYMALSLTRGRICNLVLQLRLASSVPLGSESHGARDHILLSQFLRLRNLEGQVPIFTSPRNRVTQLYPRALGSLSVASYDS